jgi:hypothetical protein
MKVYKSKWTWLVVLALMAVLLVQPRPAAAVMAIEVTDVASPTTPGGSAAASGVLTHNGGELPQLVVKLISVSDKSVITVDSQTEWLPSTPTISPWTVSIDMEHIPDGMYYVEVQAAYDEGERGLADDSSDIQGGGGEPICDSQAICTGGMGEEQQ